MARHTSSLKNNLGFVPLEHKAQGSLKGRVYEVLDLANANDRVSRFFDVFIVSLVLLNVAALILETVDSIHESAAQAFLVFEIGSVLFFSIEYLLRVWSCTVNPEFRHPVWGRIHFMLSPLALIDLAAILPFYIAVFYFDLRFLRSMRLFRLLRLAKLGRYSQALQTLGRVFERKKAEVVVMAFLMVLVLVTAASLMYFAEKDAQPESFPSIPAAMWWSVATVTTVGYGDVYPITPIGKLVGSIVAILGIGLFALPAALLAPGFIEEMGVRRKEAAVLTCPHCKRQIPPS